ncbi:MAG: DUF3575 domain-containing protein, partial [Bacteroidota bacterium]
LSIALLVVTALGAMSQEKSEAIKISPISLLLGFANASYEKALGENSSAQLRARFIFFSNNTTEFSGFGLSPEYRSYPNGALNKFYWGPVINFDSFTAKTDFDDNSLDSETNVRALGAGLKIGMNWLLGSAENFVIDLGLGAQYLNTTLDIKIGEEDDFDLGPLEGGGVLPILNFSIGYAFDRKN